MRMRKIQIVVCTVFALILSVMLPQLSGLGAAQIDTTRESSLTIDYRVNNSAVANVQFGLYRVADVSPSGEFTTVGDFTKYSVSFKGLNNDGWTDLARTLADYVSRDNLSALATAKTNQSGKVTFPGHTTGLYLVIGSQHTSGQHTYTPEPFLVSMPSLNVDGAWNYDVISEPKYSSEYTPPSGGGSGVAGVSRTQCSVKKVWNDTGNTGKRPDSIVVQLLRNGEVHAEVTLRASNNWQYTWTKLSTSYTWTVVEKSVPDGYTVSVSRSGTAFTITNTLAGSNQNDPDSTRSPGSDNPNNPDGTNSPNSSGNPNTPGNPNNSGNSNNPNDPGNPNDPNNPNNSNNSNNPTASGNPNNPDNTSSPVSSNNPDNPKSSSAAKLPQTGMLWWPVPVMYMSGIGMFMSGYFYRRENGETDDDDNEKE